MAATPEWGASPAAALYGGLDMRASPNAYSGGLDMMASPDAGYAGLGVRQEMVVEADDFENHSLNTDEEFAAPDETTPKKIGKAEAPKALPSLPENRSVCPASEAPTSVISADYRDEACMFIDSPELEAWMKGLPLGQRMRVQERLAIRSATKKAEDAINLVSAGGDPDYKIWEAAALWSLAAVRYDDDYEPYLNHFGYKLAAVDKQQWEGAPSKAGTQIKFEVDGHIGRAGHTWYNVRTKLSRAHNGSAEVLEWVSPRRLVQLRLDLHHRIRQTLGTTYDEHFKETRFAKFGGPPGTTARLKSWFTTLASCINKGIAPPSVVIVTLIFLSAPLPEDVKAPAVDLALRNAGDTHSNLGSGDSQSNLGG